MPLTAFYFLPSHTNTPSPTERRENVPRWCFQSSSRQKGCGPGVTHTCEYGSGARAPLHREKVGAHHQQQRRWQRGEQGGCRRRGAVGGVAGHPTHGWRWAALWRRNGWTAPSTTRVCHSRGGAPSAAADGGGGCDGGGGVQVMSSRGLAVSRGLRLGAAPAGAGLDGGRLPGWRFVKTIWRRRADVLGSGCFPGGLRARDGDPVMLWWPGRRRAAAALCSIGKPCCRLGPRRCRPWGHVL